MNERNPLQQLVDRDLSRLQWTEARKQKVLHALNEERRPIYMKKKLSGLIALAVVLCLMTSVAFAATLVYSQRFDRENRADARLAEAYGITRELRSFFTRTSQGDFFRYESHPDFAGMPGDYLVDLSTGEVKWLFDGPTADGWDAEKLTEILRRCQTQGAYQEVTAEARAAAAAIGLLSDVPPSFNRAEAEAALKETEERETRALALATISLEDAERLARAAIQEQYGLTDAQMQLLEFVPESTYYTLLDEVPMAKPYFWLLQDPACWTEKDGIYIVTINAEDGSVERIDYDTGLLGVG